MKTTTTNILDHEVIKEALKNYEKQMDNKRLIASQTETAIEYESLKVLKKDCAKYIYTILVEKFNMMESNNHTILGYNKKNTVLEVVNINPKEIRKNINEKNKQAILTYIFHVFKTFQQNNLFNLKED
jgi:hypothetical protein